jgi:hypothetical protein
MKLLKSAALVGLSLTMLTLSGCGEEDVMTSSYYSKNPDALKSKIEECKAETETGKALVGNMKENCRTAQTVARNKMVAAIRNNAQ